MHPFKHFLTITRHRHLVMRNCFECGLYWQGLTHDLSKYGFTEFWLGAKYYLGTKSPHHLERQEKGYSEAWMHHKGRNKHHAEYWVDINLKSLQYEPVDMPDKYIAESICDRIAASKNYNWKNFEPHMALDYYHKEKTKLPLHPNTDRKFEFLLKLYAEKGEKALFEELRKMK